MVPGGTNWPDEAAIAELKVLADGLVTWRAAIYSYRRSAYKDKPSAKPEAVRSTAFPQGRPAIEKTDVLHVSTLGLCAAV